MRSRACWPSNWPHRGRRGAISGAEGSRLYFGGMARHLLELHKVLRPGARLAYVVGDQAAYLRIMIRTGNILAGIAETLGYEFMGIDLLRTRLATATKEQATKEQLREEVVLLRWRGKGAYVAPSAKDQKVKTWRSMIRGLPGSYCRS